MKRFHFPLQSLIRLREHRLDEAREGVRKATEACLEATRVVSESEQNIRKWEESMNEVFLQKSFNPHQVASNLDHLKVLNAELHTAQEHYRQAVQKESDAMQRLRLRKMDCQALERLKEKAWNDYQREQRRFEEAEAEAFHNARKHQLECR